MNNENFDYLNMPLVKIGQTESAQVMDPRVSYLVADILNEALKEICHLKIE